MDSPLPSASFALVDISNSFIKFAIADEMQILGSAMRLPTRSLIEGAGRTIEEAAAGRHVVASSVVPTATARLRELCQHTGSRLSLLDASSVAEALAINYPSPDTIGADRLANALGAIKRFGAPCVVVDFGTAVTFDIVNASREYIGGIIAPGLSAMLDYLNEKTALLPRIEIHEPHGFVGKSTEEAMCIGAVHGYRGMIRELLRGLRLELAPRGGHLRVVATGGYADLIASHLEEISEVVPMLTLEGLHVFSVFLTQKQSAG